MKKIILNKRESQTLTALNEALGLGLSQEERESRRGVEKIFSAVQGQKWNREKFHELGIPALRFLNLCVRVIGIKIGRRIVRIRPHEIESFIGVIHVSSGRIGDLFNEDAYIQKKPV